MLEQRLANLLDSEYHAWKVSPSGVVVALTRPGSYTNPRIMIGIDCSGYSQAF